MDSYLWKIPYFVGFFVLAFNCKENYADNINPAETLEDIKSTVLNAEELDGTISGSSDLENGLLEEEEDIENEQNLQCAVDFNQNVYKILKTLNSNLTAEREGRQEEEVDPDELVQSMLNLEASQILGPVLKIFGSALSNNATAIDENYNKLPYAVRYQVTDLIKFTVDLLTTT